MQRHQYCGAQYPECIPILWYQVYMIRGSLNTTTLILATLLSFVLISLSLTDDLTLLSASPCCLLGPASSSLSKPLVCMNGDGSNGSDITCWKERTKQKLQLGLQIKRKKMAWNKKMNNVYWLTIVIYILHDEQFNNWKTS